MRKRRHHRVTRSVRYEGRNFDGLQGGFEERTHRYDDHDCHNPNEHIWPNMGWERSAQFDSTRDYEAFAHRGFGMDEYNTRSSDEAFAHRGFGMDEYNTRSSDDGFSYAGQALSMKQHDS